MKSSQQLNLDTLGMGASTLCLAHCLALPLLIAVVPFFGSAASTSRVGCAGTPFDFWIHLALLGVVVPVGMTAWGLGYRRHKDLGIWFLGAVGVTFLVAALMFGHHWMDGYGERVMTIAGSIAMVSAHLLNRRQCRCSDVRGRCSDVRGRCSDVRGRCSNVKVRSQPVVGEPLVLASNPTRS